MERTTITPTPHQLRALTHPVRLRMLGLLRSEGPATATTLATRLRLNTGATSYHLRQLAQHGFVVDDDERGNGRERWWKAAHTSTRTEATSSPDDADADAMDAYLQTVVTIYTENLQRAVEQLPLLPRAWRDAGTFSDWGIRLTPASAQRLLERLDALLEEVEDEDDPEALSYVVNLNAFVRPGQVGGDDGGGPA
ncbi:helix-turn-helix domain-containing protein [Nocardioides sp. C4-1]|uniref:ArsR/SmtB family transcription factor n=1 Tax=Nocardioides sp. C4-1 TaxID=3151851 RepID=UPI003265591F